MQAKQGTKAPIAFITGGAIRVGAAICLRLAQEGYDIALHYHHSENAAVSVQQKIQALGRNCTLFQADLADIKQLQRVAEAVQTACSPQLLVNNAAIFERVGYSDTTLDVYSRHLDLNLRAPFFLTQQMAQHWQKNNQQGHVVQILDTAVTEYFDKYFSYLLSKKALAEFTQMAARTLGPLVRVNAISPGAMLPDKHRTQAQIDESAKTFPLGAAPTVDQVADAVIYLEHARYLTGQNLFVDGGKFLL